MVEHDVVGRVVRLTDFLQDDAPLALQFLGFEGRVGQDVADDVEPQRGVFLQHLDVIGGLLTRGVGVDMATDSLHLLGDRRGAAGGRTLERHVFKEMGNPFSASVSLREPVAT